MIIFWYVTHIMVFALGGPAYAANLDHNSPHPSQMTEGPLYWTATKMWLKQI